MGDIKRWDGSSWVDTEIKRWDGSSWVDAYTYKWDGTEWIQIYPGDIVKFNMTYGKGVHLETGAIFDNPECWATVDPITVIQGATYRIEVDALWAWVYSYDESDNFKTKLVTGDEFTLPQVFYFTPNTTKIRYGCYDPDFQLSYLSLTLVDTSSASITYNLTNCCSGDTTSTVDIGSSYSTTIYADSGYEMSNITVTMDGSDITSSAVSGNTITISNVTGDIVITATATIIDTGTINGLSYMTYGKAINQSTYLIENNSQCWATVNPVTVEQGKSYTIALDATWAWVYSFDDSDNFSSALVSGSGDNPQYFTFTANTTNIRFGCYDPSKVLTYCTITKNN